MKTVTQDSTDQTAEKAGSSASEENKTLTDNDAALTITEIMQQAKKNKGEEVPVISDAGEGKKRYVYPSGREYTEETTVKNTSSGTEQKLLLRTFRLSDGRTAVVRQGQGKDIRNASRIVAQTKDTSIFLVGMMAIVSTIDGRGLTYEELDDLVGKDYSRIQQEVSDLNF